MLTGGRPSFTATSSSATSTFAGGLAVETSGLVYDYSTNNVGIGTASPGVSLDVNGTLQINNELRFVNDQMRIFRSSNDMRFRTGSSDRMTIDSSGNIGIASTTPWAKLSVTNTGTGPSFVVEDSTSPDTTPFIIDASGNVGIGTADPTSKLSVLGSDGAHNFLVSDGGGRQLTVYQSSGAPGARNSLVFSGGAFELYDGTNNASRLWLSSGGYVGIGTTSPSAKFSITGSGSTSGRAFAIANGSNAERLLLQDNGNLTRTLSSTLHWQEIGRNTSYLGYLGNGTDYFMNVDTANQRVTIGPGSVALPASRFAVDGNATIGNGYVGTAAPANGLIVQGTTGVATSTPWRTLSVTGTVGFDGLTAGAGAGSLCLSANKEITYSDNAGCTGSSLRFKHDVATLTDGALETVLALRPVSFVYNDDIGVQGEQVGFIAEEVFNIDPRLVTLDASSTPNNVKYANFTAVLARAMQEIASITGAFKDALVAWLGSATNGLTRVETQELCVGATCVTPEQFQAVFGGSQVGAASAPENTQSETPSGSSTPSQEGADTVSTTTPSATNSPPREDIANELEPAPIDEPEETPPDVAPDVSPLMSGVEPLPEPANDNQPVDPLPATGTE